MYMPEGHSFFQDVISILAPDPTGTNSLLQADGATVSILASETSKGVEIDHLNGRICNAKHGICSFALELVAFIDTTIAAAVGNPALE